MDQDHWSVAKSREFDAPPLPTYQPYRFEVPRRPRLNMSGYTYPPEFNGTKHPFPERVRQLNLLLLDYYRKIGQEVDAFSDAYERCYEPDDHMGGCKKDLNDARLEKCRKKLMKSLGQATVTIAELDAIGAPYRIPDQLKTRIRVKQYVRPGTLAHLPGKNFYHSEVMEEVPDIPANQKPLLKRISFSVNRITFRQECGIEFCKDRVYAGTYKFLKEDFKKLEDSNFQMNQQPELINRVRQILDEEPEMVRIERQKEEENQKMEEEERKEAAPPSPSPPPSPAVEASGALGDVEEENVEEGDVEEENVEEENVEEVEEDYQFPSLWEGEHIYFHYSSDE